MAEQTPKARRGLTLIQQRLRYDPVTGMVSWRDGRRAGLEAGTVGHHYRQISLGDVTYFTHIVAWVLMTGEFPDIGEHIDHINRDKLDNSWQNLRLCTPSQNKMNERPRCDNKTGVRGVHFNNEKGKFISLIVVNGQSVYLGAFSEFQTATEARQRAEKKYFGEYAPRSGH